MLSTSTDGSAGPGRQVLHKGGAPRGALRPIHAFITAGGRAESDSYRRVGSPPLATENGPLPQSYQEYGPQASSPIALGQPPLLFASSAHLSRSRSDCTHERNNFPLFHGKTHVIYFVFVLEVINF